MSKKCCDRTTTPVYRMSMGQIAFLRVTIGVGLMTAAVAAIFYLAPLPDQIIKSCDRPCHDLDWPMICRVKLYIERPQFYNGLCKNCSYVVTQCTGDHCFKTDDVPRSPAAAAAAGQHQLSAPNIHVCHNDVVVVDVINRVPGKSLTLHWRGQPNSETPFMDGVPMVTQCPISSYTTFQYKFRASSPGTHVYHAYSDSARSDGLFGALIVRQSDKREPHRKLYDDDNKNHVILISEWKDKTENEPSALLINGRGPSDTRDDLTRFDVEKGRRHRFRLAFSGSYTGCPVTVTIDHHLLRVVSVDGNPTSSYEAISVVLSKGERLDFILKTNRDRGYYFLRARSQCNGNSLDGLAIINYGRVTKGDDKSSSAPPPPPSNHKVRLFDTLLCRSEMGKVCLGDVKSLYKMPEELRKVQPDRVMYLGFGSRMINLEGNLSSKVYGINNLTFTFPSSPLVSQLNDVPLETICYNRLATPERCKGKEVCECVHLDYVALGSAVEMLLINQDDVEKEHVFHLHGQHFYVVGYREFPHLPTLDQVKSLDEGGVLFKRNLNNPPLKDTIRVPKGGVVALRFLANNPGFWMLRDENSNGWTRGMDLILQVGESSLTSVLPSRFPTCGDFIGPNFALL